MLAVLGWYPERQGLNMALILLRERRARIAALAVFPGRLVFKVVLIPLKQASLVETIRIQLIRLVGRRGVSRGVSWAAAAAVARVEARGLRMSMARRILFLVVVVKARVTAVMLPVT